MSHNNEIMSRNHEIKINLDKEPNSFFGLLFRNLRRSGIEVSLPTRYRQMEDKEIRKMYAVAHKFYHTNQHTN